MKTYSVFLIITSLLLTQWNLPSVLPSAQAVQTSSVGKLSLSTAYTPPPVGLPGRRVGAGTR